MISGRVASAYGGEDGYRYRVVGNRWVFSIAQEAIGYTNSVKYFAKVGNCDLDFWVVQSDCGDISAVKGGSTSKQG